MRDKAITLTLTGRRRTEVTSLTAASLIRESDTVLFEYPGKGGKTGKCEPPKPVCGAFVSALAAWKKELSAMQPSEPRWQSASNPKGLNSGTLYGNRRRYLGNASLPPGGVHVSRRPAAKLQRDVGESVEDVSRFLDHSSLAVTTAHLRRLEGQHDGA